MSELSSGGGLGGDAREVGTIVARGLVRGTRETVPWFYANMPEYYFRTHDRDEQVRHLQAIVSAGVVGDRHVLAIRSPCGTRVTLISPGGGTAELVAALGTLAGDEVLNARLYATLDGRMRLDSFVLAPQGAVDRADQSFVDAVRSVELSGLLRADETEGFGDFLSCGTCDCVARFEVERAVRHYHMYRDVLDDDRVHVRREDEVYPGQSRIMVAMSAPPERGLMLEMAKLLHRSGCAVRRAYGDVYATPGGSFGVCSFYLSACDSPALGNRESWEKLEAQLARLKWYAGGHPLEWFADAEGMSVSQVMFMQAAAAFAHQFLAGADPHAFTAHNIVQSMLTHPAISRGLVEAFEARFDPDGHGRDRAQLDVLRRVRGQVAELSDEVERQTFRVIELFITNTLRTNYFLPDRFGLSFRMDPAILAHIPPAPGTVKDDPPYGFFFFYGAHFRGFHVRHREMARGGVRVVPTVSRENFEMESNRLFAEVTALARTQQHKNKDIPEGGSKAVILVGPQGDIDRAVKSVADSLLDIIVPGQDGPSLPQVVDYLGREEVIYLGPDEHITPSHIEWIVERARRRGFRWPSAFMSSKPSTGINHKRYGVTSLGVIVFAEEMLGMLGIDPKRDAFRVKLTGGPRGDVAGNAMLLLMRQYGTNARIVAVTDGHGAAFDPQGLDHGELEHLVREERGIAEFNPERLGAGGTVAGAGTPEGVRLRDTLHNTAEADLFIPAGGRPETINDGNWRQFLLPDGSPSARAVVEGANIFFSPQARTELERHGVLIAQGASANKTGVICSSYEVLAGLTLSDEEFLAVKDEYVAEVLDILRIRARSEARLMLREYRRCGAARPLTAITTELSREINALADGIAAELGQGGAVANDPLLRALVLEYCPPLLSARYEDRIFTRIPEEHLRALVAAYAASRIVYAEGLGWMSRVGARGGLVEAVRSYLRQEAVVAAYRAELRAAGLTHVRELLGILDATACKFLTERDMGIEAER